MRTFPFIFGLQKVPIQLVWGILLSLPLLGHAQVIVQNVRGDEIMMMPDGQQQFLRPNGANGPRTFDQSPTRYSPETGEVIPAILKEGTRRPESLRSDGRFPANPFPFKRPSNAVYVLNTADEIAHVWFDPTRWTPVLPEEVNPEASAVFNFLGGEAIAILVQEPVEVDLEQLVNMAYENAKTVATDVRMGVQEYRDVNDRFVLCVRMDGGQNSQVYTYFSYYYSGQGFTLQFTLYATRESFLRYQSEFRDLLNGLVIK